MRFRVMFLVGVLFVAGLVTACSGGQPTEEPVNIDETIATAAANIRAVDTFRMEVLRTGAPYVVPTDLGDVGFRRALAQYVAPATLQATIQVLAAGIATDVYIFSEGEEQWYRHAFLTANRWFNAKFAEGFNPESLIAKETGFQAALASLISITYEGIDTLEDGTAAYHFSGRAHGPDVSALVAGLIEATGEVLVDVFIDPTTIMPVRFVIIQPDTVTEDEPEPTTWTVDVYDINAEPEIENPADNAIQILPAATPTPAQ